VDPTSTVRTDALPAIATLVIPGAFASIPFAWVLVHLLPEVGTYLATHDGIAALIGILVCLAVGFIVESLGSFIEVYLIDKTRKDHRQQLETWWRYLRVAWDEEPIGQRYLRRLLVTFKFELNMAMAMLLATIGFTTLACINAIQCQTSIAIIVGTMLAAVAFYFLARVSSSVLAQLRRQLIMGVGEPPFDEHGNPRSRPLA
jgi:hypothetical protein